MVVYECRRCGVILQGDDARQAHRERYGFGHAGKPIDQLEEVG